MDAFGDLNGYERGVVARALLRLLIKQASLEKTLDQTHLFEVVIPVTKCQLTLLSCFSNEHALSR